MVECIAHAAPQKHKQRLRRRIALATVLLSWSVLACGKTETALGRGSCEGLEPQKWKEDFAYLPRMRVSPSYTTRSAGPTADPFAMGAKERRFKSELLGRDVSYVVRLPRGYTSSPKLDYPVIFFLPGASAKPWQVGAFLQHLNTALERGIAPEMIVIGVNAIAVPAYYVDARSVRMPLESVIVKELIAHVDATYRTRDGARAIEGYSMGGYGALHLALQYPGTFVAATSLAGYVFTADMAESAGPGELVNTVWCQWLDADHDYAVKNDVLNQLEQASPKTLGNLSIRLGYGQQEPHTFIKRSAEKMRALLTARNQPVAQFVVAPGVGHSDIQMYDRLGPQWFAFYGKLFAERPVDLCQYLDCEK